MATLYHISYSPWSEKARWAIAERGVRVTAREYLPMLGEPLVRVHARRFTGRVTMPLLVDGRRVLADSFDIARWADERGSGAPLFPPASLADIRQLNELGERVMTAGRARTTARAAERPEVLVESVPPPIARLRPLALATGRFGTRYLARKYGFSVARANAYLKEMREALTELRRRLAERNTFLGDFSYADIAVAPALQFVEPVADRFVRLGPASRQTWREPELAEEFADLVAWRDRLYASRR
ncbi:MAG: glutathione S-transferase family protein [Myxococcales bacterium]|nr:glutathione S-transferase family protein [Myxococcales bacterium]MCB9578840.1 glutathione S-transferase family protein [Polyangiaceae bacterium]